MRGILKLIFRNVMDSLKKNLKTRDQWILKWPGQLCITSSQVRILHSNLLLHLYDISLIKVKKLTLITY